MCFTYSIHRRTHGPYRHRSSPQSICGTSCCTHRTQNAAHTIQKKVSDGHLMLVCGKLSPLPRQNITPVHTHAHTTEYSPSSRSHAEVAQSARVVRALRNGIHRNGAHCPQRTPGVTLCMMWWMWECRNVGMWECGALFFFFFFLRQILFSGEFPQI